MKRILFWVPIATLAYIFRGLLFQHLFFNNNDVISAFLPYLYYLGHSNVLIAQGILFGFPAYVSTVSGWFYPLNKILFSFMGLTSAYVLLTGANMLLAYVCAYAYAKKIGLSVQAAVMAALVYIFSFQLMVGAVYVNNTGFYFILPASLYFFELALGVKHLRRGILLGIAGLFLGVGWLSSHVQFVAYIHVFFFAYVVFRVWGGGYVRSLISAARTLALPYLVSFIAGLPMILAVLSFQHESVRAGGVSLAEAVSGGYLPWDVLYYVLPFWGINFLPSHGNLYIGVIPFLFLLFAFFSYRALARESNFFTLYLGTFLFCLTASIAYSPLGFALHYLPLFNAFRNPTEVMFIGQFAEAMLAGIVLDYITAHWGALHLWQHPALVWFKRFVLYVFVPVVVVATFVRVFLFNRILALLDNYFLVHIYPHTTGLPQEHYLTLIGSYAHQAIDQFSIADDSVLLFLALSALLLAGAVWQKKLSARQCAAFVVVLTALNFALAYGSFFPLVSASTVTAVPQTAQAIQHFDAGGMSPFRVYSILTGVTLFDEQVRCGLSDAQRYELSKELLVPNTNLSLGFDVAGGYDNYMPQRVSDALGYIGSESSFDSTSVGRLDIPVADKLHTIVSREPALAALNIRYVVSSYPIVDPSFVNVYSKKFGACATPIMIYRLANAWPRYFVTNRVEVTQQNPNNADAVLGELASTTQPTIVLDESFMFAPSTSAFVNEVLPTYSQNTITFKNISCRGSCMLLVGDADLPAWSAYVDGNPARLLRANYLFMAVPLVSGTHVVELRYAKPLNYW